MCSTISTKVKSRKRELGKVVTCCKPSSGAAVVCMAIPLRGWVCPQPWKMATASRCSYHSATLLERWICQKKAGHKRHLTTWSGAQGCEFEPRHRRWFFWPFFVFGILAIMFILCTCVYSVSGVYIIIYNVAACIWWRLLYLNCSNIGLRLAAILKKVEKVFLAEVSE